MFIDELENEIDYDYNVSETENGALGYKTTNNALVDLNFKVASLRSSKEEVVKKEWSKAYLDEKKLSVLWLFYLRDAREGLGERRSFRIILKQMSHDNPELIKRLINLIPKYGRFDDLWVLLDTELKEDVILLVKEQLYSDMRNMIQNQPVSLLAKWLPSVNASSKETIRYAREICEALGHSEKEYRKALSSLRKYLDVVEVKMSDKDWEDIDYNTVPSQANLKYNSAFLRNDEARRRVYLARLAKGDKEVKINASTLYPHDIVHKYMKEYYGTIREHDETLEQLWKNLPNTVKECGNVLVVRDGSGSMTSEIGNTKIEALDVSTALSIYFSERSSGQFKDKFITFSSTPKLIDLSKQHTLYDKIQKCMNYDDCSNTDIEAVFNLILYTAVNNKMKQSDLPKTILIISDMEFDGSKTGREYRWSSGFNYSEKLFESISKNYHALGYELPRLVFWNVNSRTNTIPVKSGGINGLALVSGFSVNICKMVMSGNLDPFECLKEQLLSDRYKPVAEIVDACETGLQRLQQIV